MNAPVKTPAVTFAEAFVKLQAEIRPAIKDATNPAFRSKYADLGAVWEAVKGPLHDNGFAVIQSPDFDGETMWLATTIMHTSGEYRMGRYPIRPIKPDPQGFGSAITYARRYSLSAMLGVISEEDDDGNAASQRPSQTAQEPRYAPHAPKPAPEPQRQDDDIEQGVRNWTSQRKAELSEFTRLPELYQWRDTHDSALARLKSKHPAAYAGLMLVYQDKLETIHSKETETP